jgi:hypothetical protein
VLSYEQERKIMATAAELFKKRARPRIQVLGDTVELELRAVTMGEITSRAGSPPSYLAASLVGEKDAELDPSSALENVAYAEKLTSALVCVGVLAAYQNGEKIAFEIVDSDPNELQDHQITPRDLGDDLPKVYNTILELSGLPLGKMVQRFPAEVVGDSGRDGKTLQSAPKRPARRKSG